MRRVTPQARTIESILEIIGGTNQKIEDLQGTIVAFIEEHAEAARRNPDLDVSDEGGFNAQIDEIVSDIWEILRSVLPLLPRIADGGSGKPAIWRRELPTPLLIHGPEKKSTLPIIDALDLHAREDAAVALAVRNLIRITGDGNRELRLMREADIVSFGQRIPQPNPKNTTVGFVPHENTQVELALIQCGDIIFSKSNSVVHHLRDILEGVETLVEKL